MQTLTEVEDGTKMVRSRLLVTQLNTHIESYTVEWAALVLLVLFWVFHGARNLVILQLGMTIHIVLVFEVILSFTVLTLIISQSTLLL